LATANIAIQSSPKLHRLSSNPRTTLGHCHVSWKKSMAHHPLWFWQQTRLGGIPQDINIVVSTTRMNQIVEHAIGDLTVTVQGGVKYGELQKSLAQAGQFLALDPSYRDRATIGGIVATADTGSLRQGYKSVRDQLLGISFIRSDGQLTKAGGRVVKNVAGYDLMKLLTGSYGTLGIISQVTFRLYPQQAASQTVLLTGDADAIGQAHQTVLNSALTSVALDILSPLLIETLELGSGMGLIAQFSHVPESVTEQSQRLLMVGEKLGLTGVSYSQDPESTLWERLRKIIETSEKDGSILCKIGVRPTEAVAMLNQSNTLGVIHASSGLGRLRLSGEMASSSGVLNLRKACEASSGFLTILSAPMEMKQQIDIWGYSGNGLKLMQGIKHQFDPKNIFSPHRFIPGI
jgi:glycolate oxidase FAD binding subunit